jgi:hypothetical protein
MTGLVKVLEIQPVVPNPINRGAVKSGLADVELQNKDDRADQKHDVNPPSHPRYAELDKDRAIQSGEFGLALESVLARHPSDPSSR